MVSSTRPVFLPHITSIISRLDPPSSLLQPLSLAFGSSLFLSCWMAPSRRCRPFSVALLFLLLVPGFSCFGLLTTPGPLKGTLGALSPVALLAFFASPFRRSFFAAETEGCRGGSPTRHSEGGPPDLERKNPCLPNIQVLPGCRSSYPLKGKKSFRFARA